MGDAYRCDRCGNLFSGIPHAGIINWIEDGKHRHGPERTREGDEIDELCASCQRKYEEFMDV